MSSKSFSQRATSRKQHPFHIFHFQKKENEFIVAIYQWITHFFETKIKLQRFVIKRKMICFCVNSCIQNNYLYLNIQIKDKPGRCEVYAYAWKHYVINVPICKWRLYVHVHWLMQIWPIAEMLAGFCQYKGRIKHLTDRAVVSDNGSFVIVYWMLS